MIIALLADLLVLPAILLIRTPKRLPSYEYTQQDLTEEMVSEYLKSSKLKLEQ